jgi:hypothetical protein
MDSTRQRDDEPRKMPPRTIRDVAGMFRDRVHGKSADWDTARAHAEVTVARQVAEE